MSTEALWMRRAAELERQSVLEPGRITVPPKVGVVLLREGVMLAESFRGQTGVGDHAEYGLLEKQLPSIDISGATVLTTLEPCSHRNDPDKIPCAERLVRRGIARVYIGIYDPNPRIYREGWRILRDGGVDVRDFAADVRAEIAVDNAEFINSFRLAVGDRGSASFDYRQNGGKFRVASSWGDFETTWTEMSDRGIYALDYANHVALARHARTFGEIDDPGALDYASYSVPVDLGEIAVFRNQLSFLLAQVTRVSAGPRRGQTHWEVAFDYEVRGPTSASPASEEAT